MSVKVVLSYILGVAVGAGCATWIVRDYYRNVADEEIASVKETLKRRIDDRDKNEEVNSNDICEDCNEHSEDEGVVNYANKYKGGDESDYILNELAEKEYPKEDSALTESRNKKNKKKKNVKVIKEEDYDAYPQYRKMVVYFFVGDNVVADEYDCDILKGEDDRPIGKFNDFIPIETLNKYGFVDNDDQGVIYIRNEELSIDFEVIKDFGTYADIMKMKED